MVYGSAMDVEFPWVCHSNILENLRIFLKRKIGNLKLNSLVGQLKI